MPAALPDKEIGVEIVKLVNEKIIPGCPADQGIQGYNPQEMERRGKNLVNAIRERGLLPFTPPVNYVVALNIWHGCICMAKNLRTTYVVGEGREAPITMT